MTLGPDGNGIAPRASGTLAPEMVLVRYGEIALKGGNRSFFERTLCENIRTAARSLSPVKIQRRHGRLMVFPEQRVESVARRLRDVFGIVSISPAYGVPPDVEVLAKCGLHAIGEALEELPADRRISFRVETSRADKSFHMLSTEVDRYVADRVLAVWQERLRVQLVQPELTLGIDLRPERAYVFTRRLPGPGGLPVGTLGRALCLLSGGIDSPVAAWMTMKRGCGVDFVSFHSPPYLGESSKLKIEKLVRRLARFQPRCTLYSVPFTEAQTEIKSRCPEGYRTILYRRMMQRIATRIAEAQGAKSLVTGESLGQVASQTMENIACIGEATHLPVLRPLIGFDKTETVEIARRIGTFDVSSEPEPDCCTVFLPRKPVIYGKLDKCIEAEEALDLAGIVARAVEGAQVTKFVTS